MKKVTIGLVFLATLASCKKDYVCTCDYYADGEYQLSNDTKFHETKHKAKKGCKEMNSDLTFKFGNTNIDTQTKCTLK